MKILMIKPDGSTDKEITNYPCPICGEEAILVGTVQYPIDKPGLVRGTFTCNNNLITPDGKCGTEELGFCPAKVEK